LCIQAFLVKVKYTSASPRKHPSWAWYDHSSAEITTVHCVVCVGDHMQPVCACRVQVVEQSKSHTRTMLSAECSDRGVVSMFGLPSSQASYIIFLPLSLHQEGGEPPQAQPCCAWVELWLSSEYWVVYH
jgi:hypothetical protein